MDTRLKALLAITLILAPLATIAASQYVNSGPGHVKFTIELYDASGRKITNILGMPTIPDNIKIIAQVYAIAPPNHDSPVVEIYRGELRGRSLTLQPKGLMGRIAQAWIDFERSRSFKPDYSNVSLELNLWIVDKITGKVLQRVSYFYPYNPKGLLNGKKWDYTVKIAINTTQANTQEGGPKDKKGEPLQVGGLSYYIWKLNFTVTPEVNLSVFGYENVKYHKGAYYIKLPILTIYNVFYYLSSNIGSSIELTHEKMTEFKASIGIGVGIEKKLKEGDVTGGLNGEVYLGGTSRSVIATMYRWIPPVGGASWAYVWIWARPVMLFYNEYYVVVCSGYTYEEYTGRDKVEFFVQDIITEYAGNINGKDVYIIESGVTNTTPPDYIIDWLFNDTLSEYKLMKSLSPGESYPFRVLIPSTIDTCSADFEVSLGIPLAAVLVAAGMPRFAPLAVMVAPSLSYGESETIYIGGGIENLGSVYDEILYLRVSKLQFRKDPPWWKFWEDPCYYNVPVSMYIESR